MEKDQNIIYLYGDEIKDNRPPDESDFYNKFLLEHEGWVVSREGAYTYTAYREVDENPFQASKRWIKRIIFK